MRLFGISLSFGNTKIGDAFSFSLPSLKTCPGASSWCKRYCYAFRYEKRRPTCRRAYELNLTKTEDLAEFVRVMVGTIPRIIPAFRIHVGGDFFSVAYVESWREIIQAFPQVRFWAYTRSWSDPTLLPALEELRALENVELFASTDPTMPLPPNGWRTAFIDQDPRSKGLQCPQQEGSLPDCLACGYCFRKGGHVVFKVH